MRAAKQHMIQVVPMMYIKLQFKQSLLSSLLLHVLCMLHVILLPTLSDRAFGVAANLYSACIC